MFGTGTRGKYETIVYISFHGQNYRTCTTSGKKPTRTGGNNKPQGSLLLTTVSRPTNAPRIFKALTFHCCTRTKAHVVTPVGRVREVAPIVLVATFYGTNIFLQETRFLSTHQARSGTREAILCFSSMADGPSPRSLINHPHDNDGPSS
jgi:hypothetical protein